MKFYSAILVLIFAYVCWLFYVSIDQLKFIANGQSEYNLAKIELASQDFKFAYSTTERDLLNEGLLDIEKYNSDIIVDMKYATTDNFTGTILYGDLKRAFLQEAIADKLLQAQIKLKEIDSSLNLVVFDATRPQSIQHKLWDWAITNDMKKYVASPWTGSNHNYGCAVDVSIMAKDSLLDMGTSYDHFGPEAEPRYQWELLKEGKLTQAQIENRVLLKGVMKSAGFQAIQTEWWHFNGISKERARDYYRIIP